MTSSSQPKPQPLRPAPGSGVPRSAVGLDHQGLPPNYPFNPQWEVTPRQVKVMIDQNDPLVLIDCRTPQEYSVARIQGSLLVPLHELGSRLEELREYEGQRVVVHCHHGGRSLQMAAVLRRQGLGHVYSMAGGIDLWSLDIDPAVPRY